MSELIILSIPFLGTSLGAAMVFFVRDKIAKAGKAAAWFCSRCYDRCLCVVSVDPGD